MPSPSETALLDAAPVDHAIWNPAAAACWSIVFTPAFGAYLVMRNWEALGERARALRARKWYALSLGLLAIQLLSGAIDARLNSESNLMHWVGLAYLLAWWLGAALPQALAVRQRLGPGYPRRAWDPALLAGVIVGTAYFALRACLTSLFVALT
jgi:hypothetical protein